MQVKHSGTCAWVSPSSLGCVCVTQRWVRVTVLPLCLLCSTYRFVHSSSSTACLALGVSLQCLCLQMPIRSLEATKGSKTTQQFQSNRKQLLSVVCNEGTQSATGTHPTLLGPASDIPDGKSCLPHVLPTTPKSGAQIRSLPWGTGAYIPLSGCQSLLCFFGQRALQW